MTNAATRDVTIAHKRGHIRCGILLTLFMASAVNLADRANLSITGTALSNDLGMSPITLGYVFSAFAWAYVVAQLPAGWLLDRFSATKVYGASLLLWSLVTVLQGFVGFLPAGISVAVLIALRFGLGLVESPVSPANSYIVATWFPIRERGLATSIYNSAQYAAVAIFVPFMGFLVARFGWPSAFWVIGVLGMLLSIYWFRTVTPPSAHPYISGEELAYIQQGGALIDADSAGSGRAAAPVGAIRFFLSNRLMLGVYMGQYCLTSLQYFFLTWFPIYLVRGRGLNVMDAGILVSFPAITGFIGGLLGGYISDALSRHGYSVSVARKVPFVTGLLLASSLVLCNFVDSTAVIVVLMSLAIFGKGLAAVNWAVVSDTAPPALVGLAGGLFNLFGSVSGIVTPIVIGYVLQLTGSFTVAMYFVAAHGLIGALCYLVVIGKIRPLAMPSTDPLPVSA